MVRSVASFAAIFLLVLQSGSRSVVFEEARSSVPPPASLLENDTTRAAGGRVDKSMNRHYFWRAAPSMALPTLICITNTEWYFRFAPKTWLRRSRSHVDKHAIDSFTVTIKHTPPPLRTIVMFRYHNHCNSVTELHNSPLK